MQQTLTPEQRLLVALCAPRRDDVAIGRILENGVEWQSVLDLAARNNVLSLLPSLPDENCPRRVRSTLDELRRDAAFMDRLGVILLDGLRNEFATAGIPIMLLKGLGVAERFYARPQERYARDIDLIVPDDQKAAAGRILERLDYTAVDPPYYERTHFHYPYVHNRRARLNVVELHWDLSAQHSNVRFGVEQWWERARPAKLRSGEILVPSPVDQLVHLAWHAFNHGSVPLRDLQDLAHAAIEVEREGSWAEVNDYANRSGAREFVCQGLHLTRALWNVPETAPEFLQRNLRPGRWVSRNLFRPRTVVQNGRLLWWPLRHICYWSLLPRGRSGWLDLVRTTIRDEQHATDTEGAVRGAIQAVRAVSTLGVALGLCLWATEPWLRDPGSARRSPREGVET